MDNFMNTGEYDSGHTAAEYDEEVMCAGWNPSLALAHQQLSAAEVSDQKKIAAELSTRDMEAVLQNIYNSMR